MQVTVTLLIASLVLTLMFSVSFCDFINASDVTMLETAFRSTDPVFTPCNTAAAFVLGSSIVAMFNSSANCTFPLFPDVAPLPLSNSYTNGTFDVTVIAIGGGGGGGSNGGGGGGAGGVTVQTVQISLGQSISVVVGLGGTPAVFTVNDPTRCLCATPGQNSWMMFPGTSVIAVGGGFGGSRLYLFSQAPGGPGGSGGGGGGGGCQSGSCGAPSAAGGSGSGSQGKDGGLGYRQGTDAIHASAGAGGGGFMAAGTAAANCLAGNGGDGYQLPFAPFMSSWIAGGGAGATAQYTYCSGSPPFGLNGAGQTSFGGGGRGGCNDNGQTLPASCNAQSGMPGALFLQYSFVCPQGTRQVVQSGFFVGSPCVPCHPGTFSSSTNVTACTPCFAGEFSDFFGASACRACAANTYNPIEGSSNISACLSCPHGTCTSV